MSIFDHRSLTLALDLGLLNLARPIVLCHCSLSLLFTVKIHFLLVNVSFGRVLSQFCDSQEQEIRTGQQGRPPLSLDRDLVMLLQHLFLSGQLLTDRTA